MAESSRPFLYVMVFIAMLNSCSAVNEARKAREELKRIADGPTRPAGTEAGGR